MRRRLRLEEAQRQARADGPRLRRRGFHQVPRKKVPPELEPDEKVLPAHPQHGRLLCGQVQEDLQQDSDQFQPGSS